jgi:hypothetical protein
MVFPKIIEGYTYGNLDASSYDLLRKIRYVVLDDLNKKVREVTAQRDKLQRDYDRMNNYHSSDVYNLKNTKSERLRTLASLKTQIANLEGEIATLEYDVKSINATINRSKNNVLIPAEREFVKSKQVTDVKLDEILPLKKKENSAANNYFNMLTSQNEEVSTEIYKQKNNLTTADRKYLINDSKHPYYITLNKGLFILYIVIALYVIYRVLAGMITQNIYGKFIIILLISLYPLYILGLEQYIYNQYLLIKAMIRAEPYVPAK